ncbi:hypothetical protein [Flavobacterium franklandianum]|uniref:DUF4199 domain-containing protein n=1 Tax=Flavobacterium franklandianum TaxID=2594430 RepID=A0A553CQF4_9FLAO|nr:hypothetical protein [Flavobacterium franklandianum]TRX22752.1 hypothetical protein FNW17_03005 [Flavobacterium franklandianum]
MKTIQNKIKILASYQILTGVLGILFLLFINLKSSSTLFIIITGLYSFSIYAGYSLLKKNFEKGLDLSIYNQLIQILGFGISGFAFEYFPGIFVSLGLNLTNDTIINYNAGFNSWILNLSSNSNLFINVNLVAIVFIIFIFKLKNNSNAL